MQTTDAVIQPSQSTISPAREQLPIDKRTVKERSQAVRCRLPEERQSMTHRFNIGGHKGYVTVGLYPDGEPGELFITMAKEGSSVSGLVSSVAQVVSVALQHGVPLKVFCEKFEHTRFEPNGFTGNRELPIATSIMDYIFRWLRLRFLNGTPGTLNRDTAKAGGPFTQALLEAAQSDSPFCVHCGSLTRRNGSCFMCANCGATTGCG
jgi:ribonucleoside-diphosphate reductase alpha chain